MHINNNTDNSTNNDDDDDNNIGNSVYQTGSWCWMIQLVTNKCHNSWKVSINNWVGESLTVRLLNKETAWNTTEM